MFVVSNGGDNSVKVMVTIVVMMRVMVVIIVMEKCWC